jgi:hypothetical protein
MCGRSLIDSEENLNTWVYGKIGKTNIKRRRTNAKEMVPEMADNWSHDCTGNGIA